MRTGGDGARNGDGDGGAANADSPKPSEALFVVLLAVAALIPRLYIALRFGSEPVWDGYYYDFGARRIAAGLGYSEDLVVNGKAVWHAWCHYPVGYSAVLGTFYHLFGANLRTAAVMNATIGAALAVATWWVASAALSRGRARVAGLLVAFHPGLLLYSALAMTEPLAALLTMTAFGLAVKTRDPWRGAAAGALLLGASALVRPQALLCAPFLAARLLAPLVTKQRGNPDRVRHLFTAFASLAVIGCLTLAPVLPWTARNCRVMDGCALVSTNAGWNLAIGAFPRATGRFETLRASDGCREVTGQVQQDRCWFAYGMQQIRDYPTHWLGLVPAKLGFTFDHESFPVEYLHEAQPDVWPEAKRAAARAFLTFVHRALVSIAAFGCVGWLGLAALRNDTRTRASIAAAITQAVVLAAALGLIAWGFVAGTPIFWPLVIFLMIVPLLPLPGRPGLPPAMLMSLSLLITTVLAHAAFFGEDRYHMVVTPLFCLFAAAMFRRSATTVTNPGAEPVDPLIV